MESINGLSFVPTIDPPSSWNEFKNSFVNSNRPVIIKGMMKDWNCYKYGEGEYLEHLKQIHGETMVDVCVSSNNKFLGDSRSDERTTIPFGTFIDQKNNPNPTHHFYLCQIPVFSTDKEAKSILPLFQTDYEIPKFLKKEHIRSVNLWCSIGSTSSNLHYDLSPNLLCVIYGKKKLLLFNPSQTHLLYPHPVFSTSSNHRYSISKGILICSMVDIKNLDLSKYPKFKNATAISVEIGEGEVLFIPEGWWHQVDSEGGTVAINIWWKGISERLFHCDTEGTMDNYYARVLMEKLVHSQKKRELLQLQQQQKETTTIKELWDYNDCELYQLNGSSFKNVVLESVKNSPVKTRMFLESLNPKQVEIFTGKIESLEDLGDDMDEFYDILFSVVDDRRILVNGWLDKKDQYAKQMTKEVLHEVIGYFSSQ